MAAKRSWGREWRSQHEVMLSMSRRITNYFDDYLINSETWTPVRDLGHSALESALRTRVAARQPWRSLRSHREPRPTSCRAATRGTPSGAIESRNGEDASAHSSERTRSVCSARPASPPCRAQEAGSVPLLAWYQRCRPRGSPTRHGSLGTYPYCTTAPPRRQLPDPSSPPGPPPPSRGGGQLAPADPLTATTWLRT